MADLIDRDAAIRALSDYAETQQDLDYYRDMLIKIPAVNRWISVEDEYPEPCKSVLIAFRDSSGVRLQCVGIRSATHPNVWLDMHGGRIKNITHWQYLPEPPEKE